MNIEDEPRHWEGVKDSHYYLLQTLPQFLKFYYLAIQQKYIAVDTETTGLDYIRNQAFGISIGWCKDHNYFLPIRVKTEEKQLDIEVIKPYLIKLLGNEETVKIFANEKFDRHMLKREGIEVGGITHDIVTIAHLLDENMAHGVKPMAEMFIDKDAGVWEDAKDLWVTEELKRRRKQYNELIKVAKGVKAEEKQLVKQQLIEKYKDHICAKHKKDEFTWDYIDLEVISPYACADTHYTFDLFFLLIKKLLTDEGLVNVYKTEQQYTQVLYSMEEGGIKINKPYLQEVLPKLKQEISIIETELYKELEIDNIDSDQQVIAALQRKGVEFTKLTKGSLAKKKSGDSENLKFSIDKEVLETLALDYEIAGKLKERNDLTKLVSTYVENLIEMADENDVIHSTFRQNVSTGRGAAANPNLQNLPARDKTIRKAFITLNSDYYYFFIDESQVELRLMTHHSQDPALLDCYATKKDVHSITTAEIVLEIPLEELMLWKGNKEGHTSLVGKACECKNCLYDFYRGVGKKVNFAQIFGVGPESLAKQVSTPIRRVTSKQCEGYMANYFKKYTGVQEYIKTRSHFVSQNGWVRNTFGRCRRLPHVFDSKRWLREKAQRQAVNFDCQGDAADVFKIASVRIFNILKEHEAKSRLVSSIHDELQFYIHKDELHLVPLFKRAMEDFPQLTVQLQADVSYSKGAWSEKQEIKF